MCGEVGVQMARMSLDLKAKGEQMTHRSIRVLAIAVVFLFVISLAAAIWGEADMAAAAATRHFSRPSPFAGIPIFGSVMIALSFVVDMSVLGLAMAFQRRQWPWMIAIVLIVVGLVLIYLGVLGWVPLLSFLTALLNLLPLPGMPKLVVAAFVPMLVGSVALVSCSYQVDRTPHPRRTMPINS
jgi:hypothetical protein